jgi:hypothetical protein
MKNTITAYAILLTDKKTKAQEFALHDLLRNPRPVLAFSRADARIPRAKFALMFAGKRAKVVKVNVTVEVAK